MHRCEAGGRSPEFCYGHVAGLGEGCGGLNLSFYTELVVFSTILFFYFGTNTKDSIHLIGDLLRKLIDLILNHAFANSVKHHLNRMSVNE